MKRFIRPGLSLLFALLMTAVSLTAQAATITGSVTPSPGTPSVDGKKVFAHTFGTGSFVSEAFITNESYTMENIPVGDYLISIDTSGTTFVSSYYNSDGSVFDSDDASPVVITTENETKESIDLTVTNGPASISGFILSDTNTPLAGIEVGCWNETHDFWKQTQTDDQGYFMLDGLLGGDISLEIDADEASAFMGVFQAMTLGNDESRDIGTLIRQKGARVSGTLRFSDNSAPEDLWVYVDGRVEMGGTDADETTGEFVFFLPPGTYTVGIENENDASHFAFEPVEVTVNEALTPVELGTLTAEDCTPSTISGSVTLTGSDLTESEVEVLAVVPAIGLTSTFLPMVAKADVLPGGSFTLADIPSDPVDIVLLVKNPDGGTIIERQTGKTPGTDSATFTFSDNSRHQVTGSASLGDTPFQGLAFLEKDGVIVSSAKCDIDGNVAFNAIADGTYRVGFNHPGIDETVYSGSYAVSAATTGPITVKGLGAPVFDPAQGIYTESQTVTATLDAQATETLYTLDGSVPDQNNGITYTTGDPIDVVLAQGGHKVLKMVSYKDGTRGLMTVASYARPSSVPAGAIDGTISCSTFDGTPGTVYVGLYADAALTTALATTTTLAGETASYTLDAAGTSGHEAWLAAYWDANHNGVMDLDEPCFKELITLESNPVSRAIDLKPLDVAHLNIPITWATAPIQPFQNCYVGIWHKPMSDPEFDFFEPIGGSHSFHNIDTANPASIRLPFEKSDIGKKAWIYAIADSENNGPMPLGCSDWKGEIGEIDGVVLSDEATLPLTFSQVSCGDLSGTVTKDGAGLENVTLEVFALVGRNEFKTGTTQTDTNGSYSFPGLPEGFYEVRPGSNELYTTAERQFVQVTSAGPNTLDVPVTLGASISGTITLNGLSSPEGVWVELFKGTPCDESSYIKTAHTTTDNFVINGVPTNTDLFIRIGNYGAGSYAPGLLTGTGALSLDCGQIRNFNLAEGDTVTDANVTLTEATGRVQGTVVDDQGNPEVGVKVAAHIDNGLLYREVTTDGLGRFSITRLPECGMELQIIPEVSTRLVYREIEFSLADENDKNLGNLSLERGFRVSGTLTDSANAALAEKEIEIEGLFDTPWTKTDTDGFFELVFKPSRYTLMVEDWQLPEDERFAPKVFEVTDGDLDLGTLALVANNDDPVSGNKVAGTITGTPDSEFEVELLTIPFTRANISLMMEIDSAESDDLTGNAFALYGDPASSQHTLVTFAESEVNGIETGTVMDRVSVATLPASGIALNYKTTTGHTVTGQVLRNGEGYGDFVTLWNGDTFAAWADLDDDGAYTFFHIPNGIYTVYFVNGEYPNGVSSDSVTVADADVSAPDLILSVSVQDATAVITITDDQGASVGEGVEVKCTHLASDYDERTFTDANGQVTFDGFQTGDVKIKTYAHAGKALVATKGFYTLAEGNNPIDVTAAHGAIVTGALKLSSGDPAADIELTFENTDNDFGGYVTTAPDGSFTHVLPQGTWAMSVEQEENPGYTLFPNASVEIVVNINLDAIPLGDQTTSPPSQQSVTLTTNVGNGGSLNPMGPITKLQGTSQSFSLSTDDGYELKSVTADGAPVTVSNNTFALNNIQGDTLIVVTFARKTYQVSFAAPADGSFSYTTPQTVNHGEDLTFTATPADGFTTVWVKANETELQATGTSYTVSNVTEETAITALFSQNTYTISATAGPGGAVSPEGDVTVAHGEDRVFTVTPGVEYEVDTFQVDGISATLTGNTYTFPGVTGNHTLDVTFKKKSYTITFAVVTNGALDTGQSKTVEHGESFTFTATPAANHTTEWVKANDDVLTGSNTSYTLTGITGNKTITASFAINTYGINATAEAGGSISPNGTTSIPHGGNQVYTVTPDEGYLIQSVTIDSAPATVANPAAPFTHTFSNVTEAHAISATFAKKTYKVTFTDVPADGSLSPNTEQTVEHGSNLEITATPDSGFNTVWVKANGNILPNTGNLYTLANIQGPQAITAEFARKMHIITASAGEGGSISPSGDVNVGENLNEVFTITPATGYEIADVTIDGVSAGKLTSHTFTGVSAGHTIAASFTCTEKTALLSNAPSGTVNTPDATIGVTGEIDRYTYKLDNNQEVTVAGTADIVLQDLDDGEHTLNVRGVSICGTVQSIPTNATWTIDTIPPVATFTTQTPAVIKDVTHTLHVEGQDVATYRYVHNGTAVDPIDITTPDISLVGLAQGQHRLDLYGTDATGNEQVVPTVVSWTVDSIAPTTVLINAPTDGSVTGKTTFTATVEGDGVVSYRYTLNGNESRIMSASKPIAPTSPLADGDYTLSVVGVDAAGNWQETPTSVSWTVDTAVPTAVLSGLPDTFTNETEITIGVSGEGVSAYKYRLGSAPYPAGDDGTPAGQPISEALPGDGTFTLSVIAKGTNGTWDESSPTTYTWTVDNQVPEIASSPTCTAGTPATTTLRLDWRSMHGDVTRYEVRYAETVTPDEPSDPGAWWEAAQPVFCDITPSAGTTETLILSGLLPGTGYHAAVKATDKAGNTSGITFFGATSTEDTLPVVATVAFKGGLTTVDNGLARELIVTGENFTGETDSVRFVGTDRAFDLPCTTGSKETLTVTIPKGTPSGSYRFRILGQNGVSALTDASLAITEAPTPLPVITRIAPANLSSKLETPKITLTGRNFVSGGSAEVELEGLATAYTYDIIDNETIEVTLESGYADGLYAVHLYDDANGFLTRSTLKLEIYTPVKLTASTGSTSTSTGASMPDAGDDNEGIVPIQLTLTTDEDESAPAVSENPAEIAARFDAGTEIKDKDGNLYTGTIDPPRQVVVPESMNLEPNAVVFTLGNPEQKLSLGTDQFIFVTIDTVLPLDADAPSILYYNPSDDSLTPAGVGEDSQGVQLTRDGVDIMQGGTVLTTRENTPEAGLKTLTYGLYLNHMSTYVAGSVKSPEEPVEPTPTPTPTPVTPTTPATNGGGSGGGCFIQATGTPAPGLLSRLGLLAMACFSVGTLVAIRRVR